MIDLKIMPDLSDEVQDTLTRKELLADAQMGGCQKSLESLRKVMAYGKKKTAENVHRARNRGDATRDRRSHGPTGREIPKLEKLHCVPEGHRRLWFQRPDDGLDLHGLRAR